MAKIELYDGDYLEVTRDIPNFSTESKDFVLSLEEEGLADVAEVDRNKNGDFWFDLLRGARLIVSDGGLYYDTDNPKRGNSEIGSVYIDGFPDVKFYLYQEADGDLIIRGHLKPVMTQPRLRDNYPYDIDEEFGSDY